MCACAHMSIGYGWQACGLGFQSLQYELLVMASRRGGAGHGMKTVSRLKTYLDEL